ncbi:Xylosyltransferase 2 [Phlyctochytrium bullatum]|nr:Xylosyltransferase 2 [Phlyctochytrium bullatum]
MRLVKRVLAVVLMLAIALLLVVTLKSVGDDYFESYYLNSMMNNPNINPEYAYPHMYKTYQRMGWLKQVKQPDTEPLVLTPSQQAALDQPLFAGEASGPLARAAAAENRFVRMEGFKFCKGLNNASFDALAHVSAWGQSLAKRNPGPAEFAAFVDGEAAKLSKSLHKYGVYKKEEVDRFSCFSVADGANPFANVSQDRLLHRIDPVNYFESFIPSIRPSTQQVIPGPRRKYHFAYLLMVHGNKTMIENVQNMLDILDDGSAIFLIHVDLKSKELYTAVADLIERREAAMNAKWRPKDPPVPGNVFLAQNRFDGLWGHASLVNIEVSGFWELLDLADWEFVINVSGFDFPMRYSREIYRVMSLKKNKGKQFINYWEDTSEEAFRMVRPYLSRTNKVFKGTKLVTEMTSYHPLETGLFFPPFSGWKLCQQSQWMVLTRNFVKHLRTSLEALHVLAFIQHTFVPDQSYFCYVAINTPYFAKRTDPQPRHFFHTSYNDRYHATQLDLGWMRHIRADHNRDAPRYFFARKVDLRSPKGREVAKWIQREHLKRNLQVGGYGELPGGRFVEY